MKTRSKYIIKSKKMRSEKRCKGKDWEVRAETNNVGKGRGRPETQEHLYLYWKHAIYDMRGL